METSYLNPVYNHPFADPFVLKHRGEYWAYCTGAWRDGRWFAILRSRDLAYWEEVGGAMEPLAGNWPCLWAPEVSYYGGRFYLYYSCGDEATMQIRVAVAEHPAGPFIDSGRRLTREAFAIDPHVFADEDGSRHLFYATDYLEHSHVGTGTARDRLRDPLTLEGRPVPVTRALYDWQIYEPSRAEKGGVRWHTIEGSFVLRRKGHYYQMFSGGNWQNPTYGVSYAVADRIDGEAEWEQAADGEAVLPILRTIPGLVIGPGHNSVVRGPDNRELYCVYHRWAPDGSSRVMAIDPLDWAGERMFLLGPSTEPRPLALPTHADFFEGPGLGPAWAVASGSWSTTEGAARQPSTSPARATFTPTPPIYLAELSVAALDPATPGGYGVAVGQDALFLIEPVAGRAIARLRRGETWEEQVFPLTPDLAPETFHLLRVEARPGRVSVTLDEHLARWSADLPGDAAPLALVTEGAPAAFAGFALTEGWQDLFEVDAQPAALGWASAAADGVEWAIRDGALLTPATARPALLLKGPLPAAYELAVNLRLAGAEPAGGSATIYPAARNDDPGPALTMAAVPGGFTLSLAGQELPLPAGFEGGGFYQLRVRVAVSRLDVSLEGRYLGGCAAPVGATHVGLGAHRAAVTFEMVRITALAA